MKLYFELEENETPSNFNIAEAILRACNGKTLNAEVVAKMILLQIESMKGGE